MFEKLKRLYKKFLIFERRNSRLYDEQGNELINKEVLNIASYIIFEEEMYEIHSKF